MTLAGDTKVPPKFAFLLQTFDAGDEAPTMCLETPTVAICFGMAKSVAVTVTAVQHAVRCASLTFFALLLLCHVFSKKLLSTDKGSVAHQYPSSRRFCSCPVAMTST